MRHCWRRGMLRDCLLAYLNVWNKITDIVRRRGAGPDMESTREWLVISRLKMESTDERTIAATLLKPWQDSWWLISSLRPWWDSKWLINLRWPSRQVLLESNYDVRWISLLSLLRDSCNYWFGTVGLFYSDEHVSGKLFESLFAWNFINSTNFDLSIFI